jgi:capsular polysaccharide export protein
MRYSTSKQLTKNTKSFLEIKYYSFFDNIFSKKGVFYGWGRKKSGLNAVKLAHKYNTSFVLLEDGFIRSLGLGVDGSPSFSIVEDDIGIYYDATTPSKLENILNEYDFKSDNELMQKASRSISLIKKYHISKYNNAPDITEGYFAPDEERVLVIAQTAGDASLEYGMLKEFTTQEIVNAAIDENPNAVIYIKIHPDVLSGKKKSDIDIKALHSQCKIISEDVNPISLLQHFKKVYTKTSGMGFEALLVGCECVCFGMPYYAGWGLTDDRVECKRRKRLLRLEEVFAAAYILYTRYHNPYTDEDTDILGAIEAIVKMRN